MKATLSKIEDVVVINLSGHIDMEYTENFREACLKDFPKRSNKLIFNLKDLSFVGSNGIMLFVNTLRELAMSQRAQMRFCSVSSEFQKVFAASPLSQIEIFESEDHAVASLRSLDFLESKA